MDPAQTADTVSAWTWNGIYLPFAVGGLLLAFFGWTIYWTGMFMVGAFLGATSGATLGFFLADSFDMIEQERMLTIGVCAAVGALLGALTLKKIQQFAFFLAGGGLGGLVAWKLIESGFFKEQDWATEEVAIVGVVTGAALAGGVLILLARRYVISVVSAAVGSILFAWGVPYDNPALIAGPLFAISTAAQLGLVRRFVSRERVDRSLGRRAKS